MFCIYDYVYYEVPVVIQNWFESIHPLRYIWKMSFGVVILLKFIYPVFVGALGHSLAAILHWMAQMTFFSQPLVPFGVSVIKIGIWTSKTATLGAWIGIFMLNSRNMKTFLFFKFYVNSNQILHNNKDLTTHMWSQNAYINAKMAGSHHFENLNSFISATLCRLLQNLAQWRTYWTSWAIKV